MNKIKTTLIIIGIILSILTINIIIKLNILPIKYTTIILSTILVINILGIITIKSKLKILGIIIYIIIITISLIATIYGIITLKYIKTGFNNNNIEITKYDVLVLKESNINDINELKNIGYLKNKIENNYIETIEKQEYQSIYKLYEDLINKNIDSIILHDQYIELLQEKYKDINEKTKIIHTIKIEDKKKKTTQIKELKPINIYISGSDSRNTEIEENTRTDVNMIMTINPNTNEILLTSIPRDYYVQLHETTGIKDKLTHSGIYGIEMSKKTLEDTLDIKIDYVVKVGFQSVIEIVDMLDGIDIESDQEFFSHCGDGGATRTQIKKGINHLNGSQALSYARERYAYKEGDNHRIQNQQQVLEAIIKKMLEKNNANYSELLDKIKKLYRTDIPESMIKLYIKKQINDNKKWTIKKQVLTGIDSMDETYSMPGIELYVMIPDEESIKKAKNNIEIMQSK